MPPIETLTERIPAPILSLSQVPGLECLAEICGKFDVEITAFGSLVRRLAFRGIGKNSYAALDLFDLAPFLSDIDLYHSGAPSQTVPIQKALLNRIPYAECFRWEIYSETDLKPFRDDESKLPIIPLNKLSLATRDGTGIRDPFNAKGDIESGQFRLISNAFYNQSALKAQLRDSELLHVLAFLQIVAEHGSGREPQNHPGWQTCVDLLKSIDEEAFRIALGESAFLRAKIVYRLRALAALCQSAPQRDALFRIGLTREVARQDEVSQLINLFLSHMRFTAASCMTSGRLGGNVYRFQTGTFERASAEDAESAWGQLSQKHQPLPSLTSHSFPQLTEKQRVVAVSPPRRFSKGSLSKTDRYTQGKSDSAESMLNEMVHLQLKLQPREADLCKSDSFRSSDLGVLVVLTAFETVQATHGCVVALPSVCSIKQYTSGADVFFFLQARVNFGRILEVFPNLIERSGLQSAKTYQAQFFVVAEYE